MASASQTCSCQLLPHFSRNIFPYLPCSSIYIHARAPPVVRSAKLKRMTMIIFVMKDDGVMAITITIINIYQLKFKHNVNADRSKTANIKKKLTVDVFAQNSVQV